MASRVTRCGQDRTFSTRASSAAGWLGAATLQVTAAKAGSITIADAIADTIAKIGENMTLRRAAGLRLHQS